MAEVISISSLTKRFGEIVAVDDLSFSVREGEQIGRASCRERVCLSV